ncbi:MAG: tryptophan 2,3-dioxygenase [Rhodobacter sp.]|nr:tryptophan 2,3-dioxygenase [Rhodobacter sp.]
MTDHYDPAEDGAEMAFDGRMSYGDYLHLDAVLGAQAPLSEAHDEMLFVIQHQTSELWLKLVLHELRAARAAIAVDDLPPAFKMLARIARIFEQLNGAWDVLRTMTPSDYTAFREALGQSSGFQSHQYRMVEFMLGNRNPSMLRPHAHRAELRAALEQELVRPSLYDEVLRLAARLGHTVPDEILGRDVARPHREHGGVVEMWRMVYADTARHWTLYELAEKLVDLEDYFRRWRFNHVTTVERVIGVKRGTGGTSGVAYLRRMLEVELFPDLWRVRTVL